MAEKQAQIRFRRVVAVTVAATALGACSTNGITADTTTESATATATTSTTAPTTTTTTTTTSTTTSTTTTTTTTTLPDPCAEFNSLTLSGQMAAVRNQQAPPNPECEPGVTNATNAVQTADAAADLAKLFAAKSGPSFTGEPAVAVQVDCEAKGAWSVELINHSNYPVAIVGFYWAGDATQATGIRMMQSLQLPPDTTVTDTSTIAPMEQCNWRGIALLGGDTLAPFDQAGTAPADDPQASDDPAVWFPALQEQLNIGRANGSEEYLIDHVYDLHSLGINQDLFPKEGDTVGPASLTYCASLGMAPPAGLEGEWTALLLAGDNGYSDDETHLNIGFFARGNDRRWRVLSLKAALAFAFDESNPCAAPPLM